MEASSQQAHPLVFPTKTRPGFAVVFFFCLFLNRKTHRKRKAAKLQRIPINTPTLANDWLALDEAESCTVLFK